MRLLFLLTVCAASLLAADADVNGRWNIRVPNEARARAWWLDVSGAGTPQVRGKFVGAPGGQLDDIPEIAVRNGELRFVFTRKYRVPNEKNSPERQGVYTAKVVNGRLEGTFTLAGQPPQPWTGTRAPIIKDRDDNTWKPGSPVALFNGKDLSGWSAMVPGQPLGWTVKDGIMTNVAGANNLTSDRRFWNFILTAEYRYGPHSNSGIGLRGRYEVQIYDDHGKPADVHGNGALYSRKAADVNASKAAGEWQTMEIRLVGRQLSVTLNGKKIHDKVEVDGLTAMANDPNEAEPGPITIQGNHGSVEFRKLVVVPLTR